jgi:hypothetical protein
MNTRWLLCSIPSILLLALLLLVACAGQPQPTPALPSMLQQPLALETWHLFDVGVADVNDDGMLDIFSSNHSARQSLLLGNGKGHFSPNQLLAQGLSQSSDFPGLADTERMPAFRQPGLYIFWRASRLVLHSHHLSAVGPMQGTLCFQTAVDTETTPGLTLKPVPQESGTCFQFVASADAEAQLTPQPYPRVGVPISVELAETTPLTQIFVGANAISPSQRHFTLALQDRHGLVWADFNADGQQDLFVAGGANRGLSGSNGAASRPYELFYRGPDSFRRISAPELGLQKGSCAARQARPIDFNGDGLLDLYIVCIRGQGNQLFQQRPAGHFTDIAPQVGLALPDAGTFAWLDVDLDGEMDLLWAGESGIWLYRQQAGQFVPEKLPGPQIWVQNIALGDFDNDGDGDIFMASGDANLLYRNDDGTLTHDPPAPLGLPKTGLSAHWLDYDNDGLLDLFVADAGLYRQNRAGQFVRVPVLTLPPGPHKSARATWFDANNDGFREALIALQNPDKQWQSLYFRHPGGSNHWLTLNLQGPPGNRPAVGTRVTLITPQNRRSAVVGWNEESHYGSGHYRLYFGLGPATQIDTLELRWPDGSIQHLRHLAADQHLMIKWQP